MEWFKRLDIKRKIGLIAIVLLVIAGIIFAAIKIFGKEEPKNVPEIKYNKNPEILKEREIEGLLIHDISLQKDGPSNYRAKATNKTNEKINFVGVQITFYNDTKEIGKIDIYNEQVIEPGQTIDLVNYNDMDLLGATSLKIEMVGGK